MKGALRVMAVVNWLVGAWAIALLPRFSSSSEHTADLPGVVFVYVAALFVSFLCGAACGGGLLLLSRSGAAKRWGPTAIIAGLVTPALFACVAPQVRGWVFFLRP